ncbi:general transcription and DNA repair factor IIH subunit TFB4-like isoform X6 [Salvia miltiorrhiza]|uniref:general transcription and DNA repair factor IIH subunit TFB4-like isoform X6 n=1 Tax=Salvia miltiorrhiza TaxID=226208 RepID=UPI0025AC04EE|nr:general transcription and DNA repair factor IIH subunit TFB4-like isoform X6 [Salvia miltiorrhiza]
MILSNFLKLVIDFKIVFLKLHSFIKFQITEGKMTPVSSKLYADDVSLLMVLIDTNPFFWNSAQSTLPFSKFLTHFLHFYEKIKAQCLFAICKAGNVGFFFTDPQSQNQRAEDLLDKLEEFVDNDQELCREQSVDGPGFSLLSGSLSMALCYIQRVFRTVPLHPQPRILCLHGSPDGPGQYVAIMNSIFSAQRSMVPIDACVIGAQHSAFLQQASYITGGVYLKPQILDGLFQYLSTVFATDLHSRCFLQLPKPTGVDFRASCFCHKNTIDMGYICSVCLSIFCKHQKKCSTCGSVFGQAQTQDSSTTPDRKRKTLVDG